MHPPRTRRLTLFIGLAAGLAACGDELDLPDASVLDGGLDAGQTAPPYERCPAAGASIQGTLDGEAYQHLGEGRGYTWNTTGPSRFAFEFGVNGRLYVATSTAFQSLESNAQAVLQLPDDAGDATDVLCGQATLTSMMGIEEDFLAALRNLRRLPSCESATPTSDRLSYCTGNGLQPCETSSGGNSSHGIRGTLQGMVVDLESPRDDVLGRVFATTPDGATQLLFANGRGYATLDSSGRGQLIWAGETVAEAPLVYCVEQATVSVTDRIQRVEFIDLRLRGVCDQGTAVGGDLEVCGG